MKVMYLYDHKGKEFIKENYDVETGLYRESPAYVYGLLQDEINFGKIMETDL